MSSGNGKLRRQKVVELDETIADLETLIAYRRNELRVLGEFSAAKFQQQGYFEYPNPNEDDLLNPGIEDGELRNLMVLSPIATKCLEIGDEHDNVSDEVADLLEDIGKWQMELALAKLQQSK